MNINVKKRKKILHIVADMDPKFGGPTGTISNLINYTSNLGAFKIGILSQSFLNSKSAAPSLLNNNEINCKRTNSKISYHLGMPIYHYLKNLSQKDVPNIIYGHGIWHAVNYWTSKYALKNNIPYIIHTHGMLEPWALKHHEIRKKMALSFYQKKIIDNANVLVASTSTDYENLRQLGFRNPIAIIPHGVTLDNDNISVERLNTPTRKILFLSRFHAKKGVLELVEAWSQVNRSGWQLVLAGPDDRGHKLLVEKRVAELGLNGSVTFMDEVTGSNKIDTYQKADLFVLPTYSENFGMVVVEALSNKVPVITTKGAPWSDLEVYGCGWWIDCGVQPLINALNSAMSLKDQDLKLMGEKGFSYVKRYDWNDVAKKTNQLYEWILGDKKSLDFIFIK